MPAVEVWSGTEWARAFTRQSVYRLTLDADGTDQWSSLQAQIAAIPDGTEEQPVTIFLPSGSYRIDGPVEVQDRDWLIIDGEGLFTHYTDLTGVEAGHATGDISERPHWQFADSRDCVLRRLTIRGPNDQRDASDSRYALWVEDLFNEHGVAIQSASERITIEAVTVTQIFGDTVYVGGTGAANLDIVLRDITGTYMGRQGLGIVLVDGLTVEDCDIQWGGRSGMDVEPNHDTHFVWNATFNRCTFGCQFYPWVLGGSGSLISPTVKNIVIDDCVGVNTTSSHTALLGSPQEGLNLTMRRHTDMRNRSTQCLTLGAWAGTVLIEDCVVTSGPATPTTYGVWLSACTAAVTIRRNTFNGVGGVSTGADELYGVTGTAPASITTCGNVWAAGTLNDGACP